MNKRLQVIETDTCNGQEVFVGPLKEHLRKVANFYLVPVLSFFHS